MTAKKPPNEVFWLAKLPKSVLLLVLRYLEGCDIDRLHMIAMLRHKLESIVCVLYDYPGPLIFPSIRKRKHYKNAAAIKNWGSEIHVLLEVRDWSSLDDLAKLPKKVNAAHLSIHPAGPYDELDESSHAMLCESDDVFIAWAMSLQFCRATFEKLRTLELHDLEEFDGSRFKFPHLFTLRTYNCRFKKGHRLSWLPELKELVVEGDSKDLKVHIRSHTLRCLQELKLANFEGWHTWWGRDLPCLRTLYIHDFAVPLVFKNVTFPCLTQISIAGDVLYIENLLAPELSDFIIEYSESPTIIKSMETPKLFVLKIQTRSIVELRKVHSPRLAMFCLWLTEKPVLSDTVDFSFIGSIESLELHGMATDIVRFAKSVRTLYSLDPCWDYRAITTDDLPHLETLVVQFVRDVLICTPLPFQWKIKHLIMNEGIKPTPFYIEMLQKHMVNLKEIEICSTEACYLSKVRLIRWRS